MNEAAFESRYRLTDTDYLRSARHNCWRTYRWIVAGIVILLPIGAFQALLEGEHTNIALIWSLLMAAYVALLFQILLPRRARRVFQESRSLQSEMHMRLFDDRAEFENDSGIYRLAWTDVHKWDEFSDLFVLYPSSVMVILIPADRIDKAALTYGKARLAGAGLPSRGKSRKK